MSQTATYDNTLPTVRDKLRFLFSDTAGVTGISNVVTFPLKWDEEYDAAIAAWGASEGGAKLALSIGTDYLQTLGRYASVVEQFSWPDRPDGYFKLAADLRIRGIDAIVGSVSQGQPFGYHEPKPTCLTYEPLAYL